MRSENTPIIRFTSRSRLDKAINTLHGLIEGIAIDGVVSQQEFGFLQQWLDDCHEFGNRHPMNELIPAVRSWVDSGSIDAEQKADLLWLCNRLRSSEFYDKTTSDLQRLHALLGGIMADGVVTEEELRGLSDWLEEHDHLKSCWPYDEVGSLVTTVMADKKIDGQEQLLLRDFFTEFIAVLDDRTIVSPSVSEGGTLAGLCAVCPDIVFEGSRFCFTGASSRYGRKELAALVEARGGEVSSSVSAKVDYLVIGAEGNPCWAYACYGRKVERAVELRKSGVRLQIIHEHDFHDGING